MSSKPRQPPSPLAHSADLRRGRYSSTGQIYLITTTTHQRRPRFADIATGRLVVRALRTAQNRGTARTLAFVVMPDHVHWLMQLTGEETLSETVALVKAGVSRSINRLARDNEPLWQAGFHDRAIRRDEDLRQVARYVIANPLRAGLADRVGDYPLWDAEWL